MRARLKFEKRLEKYYSNKMHIIVQILFKISDYIILLPNVFAFLFSHY